MTPWLVVMGLFGTNWTSN